MSGEVIINIATMKHLHLQVQILSKLLLPLTFVFQETEIQSTVEI